MESRWRWRLDLADVVRMPTYTFEAVAVVAGAKRFQVMVQRMMGCAFAVCRLQRTQWQSAFAAHLLFAAGLAAFADRVALQ